MACTTHWAGNSLCSQPAVHDEAAQGEAGDEVEDMPQPIRTPSLSPQLPHSSRPLIAPVLSSRGPRPPSSLPSSRVQGMGWAHKEQMWGSQVRESQGQHCPSTDAQEQGSALAPNPAPSRIPASRAPICSGSQVTASVLGLDTQGPARSFLPCLCLPPLRHPTGAHPGLALTASTLPRPAPSHQAAAHQVALEPRAAVQKWGPGLAL